MKITAIFVLQVINIGVAFIFLFLFLFRLKYLSHFSQTDKYLNYYPKIRILFATIYVVLSIALLSYNVAIGFYKEDQSQYLFAGGGGQTINSLVLMLQLFVLRQQLKKQRPYTLTHMIYFFYLVVISIVRFCLTLSSVVNHQNQEIVDLILAICLMVDSCIQIGYWIAKKQTLPEFQGNHYFSFDQFRNNQAIIRPRHTNQGDLSIRLEQKSTEDDFPYIKATVNIENSKFHIILQILASNNVLSPELLDSTQLQKFYLNPSSIQGKNVQKLLRNSLSFRVSGKKMPQESLHLQIISESFYNLEQVKEIYILCGRFMIKKQLNFWELPLREVAKDLQIFLGEVFSKRQHYQAFILKFFQVDRELIDIYQQKTKQLEQLVFSYQQDGSYSYTKPSCQDKNSIFLSVQIYKQLWIQDHYIFYMKIMVSSDNSIASYPMRRFSEFQEFDSQVKAILAEKQRLQNRAIQLPNLPKKHLFNLDQYKISYRRLQLEQYLRKLTNDIVIMEIPEIRQIVLKFLNLSAKILLLEPVYQSKFYDQVKIIKGNISKGLINNDYVTFYEFKLYRQGIEIRTINKRFSDFVALNEDINRWMNNIQICYRSVNLPEKHLFKSQPLRHEKLRNYLQTIINIKEAYQIYCLNVFLNLAGNAEVSDDTFYSAISFVKSKGKDSSIDWDSVKGPSKGKELLQIQKSPNFSYSLGRQRMSALIDELGKDEFQNQ